MDFEQCLGRSDGFDPETQEIKNDLQKVLEADSKYGTSAYHERVMLLLERYLVDHIKNIKQNDFAYYISLANDLSRSSSYSSDVVEKLKEAVSESGEFLTVYIADNINELSKIYEAIRITELASKIEKMVPVKNILKFLSYNSFNSILEKLILEGRINCRIRGDFLIYLDNTRDPSPI
jgi:hypothetical protein